MLAYSLKLVLSHKYDTQFNYLERKNKYKNEPTKISSSYNELS